MALKKSLKIVEGCSIYDEFKQVYGCEFLYDENGEACWPKMAINFTQKTQFFFRIAKGAIKATDDAGVNEKTPDHRADYSANGEMDKVVKMLIDLISAQEKLKRKEIALANK